MFELGVVVAKGWVGCGGGWGLGVMISKVWVGCSGS